MTEDFGAANGSAPDRAVSALAVADWRRRIAALYAELRTATDLPAAHDHWRRTRDELFAHHPASPLLPTDRDAFTGLRVKPYDPAWRFECVIQDAEPLLIEVETGTDGVVPFERLGLVEVPSVGALDVFQNGVRVASWNADAVGSLGDLGGA